MLGTTRLHLGYTYTDHLLPLYLRHALDCVAGFDAASDIIDGRRLTSGPFS